MDFLISHTSKSINADLILPPSKSISNRALIIQALCQPKPKILNLSQSSDTQSLVQALQTTSKTIDIGDAGTSIRFITAYLSQQKGSYILTGSDRMKERPIGHLVEALNSIGADINYLEKDGFPPLAINGKALEGGKLDISTSVSSQFVSALLLIAPTLQKGLSLSLKGKLLSKPYIKMTLDIMKYFGIQSTWIKNTIKVESQKYIAKDLKVESDWSALAFILQIISIAKSAQVSISGLSKNSWQGDIYVLSLFKNFGIQYEFKNEKLFLSNNKDLLSGNFNVNLIDTPDLAQAYCCSLSALSKSAKIKGLNNLKYKESHRLKALHLEFNKIGQLSRYYEDTMELEASILHAPTDSFNSHNDHRMAMCLAPFALLFEIKIKNVEVVNKSYPSYWNDLKKMGFIIYPLTDLNN
ncbi:MAG: 3-phosphoshikimate 1-carboxyvinyltransferase [Flavobacteriales bacterium]|nr:3-phosphoshikimate 1-carboxyvinyltransferase [Flavobacteriales bacterium]|tara:strand:+ start:5865 stop:7100 length:1236 start_codon:yes stop_codon:yes gene_type:complete